MKLIINQLDIAYHNKVLIKDLSLALEPGQIVGLFGANGVGKSTLLKILMRLQPFSNGQITINDKDIANYKISDFAKLLNCLYQRNTPSNSFRVIDLLNAGRYSYADKLQNNHIVDEHLELFGLKNLANYPLNHLSGGQLQIAYLAKTFAQCSRFCILDEPTTNLDLANKRLLESVLKSKKQLGFAYLVIDHDLTFLKNICDDIINITK